MDDVFRPKLIDDTCEAVADRALRDGLLLPFVDAQSAAPGMIGLQLLAFRSDRPNREVIAFSSRRIMRHFLGRQTLAIHLSIFEAAEHIEPGECYVVDPGSWGVLRLDHGLLSIFGRR